MTAEPRSPYAASIDEARETIVVRARYYKRLVIVVSLGIVTVLTLALWLRSAWPLLALALLPPLVLAHRAVDLRAVHRWRDQAVDRWTRAELDLPLLASTLDKVPALPALTVQGMLESLPTWTSAQVTDAFASAADDMQRTQHMLGLLAEEALLARAIAWTGAFSAGVLLLVCACWAGLGGIAVALIVVPSWNGWAAARTRRLAASLPEEGRDAECFNWNGVPDRLRRAWPQPGG